MPHENQPPAQLPTIGWREWVELPDLKIKRVKAKVDTGARSSSLHASAFEYFESEGKRFVRFQVHPFQRHPERTHAAVAPLLDIREIKSSSGNVTRRPVILAQIRLMGDQWPVELTLAERTEMGFRMLLGREAIRNRFVVDAGNSFFSGIPYRKRKRRKRKPE